MTATLAQFMDALSGQESGGDWEAENDRTGAFGRWQILPSNWPAWAVAAGLPANAPQNAANQEAVARHRLGLYWQEMGNWADVAAAWYSGQRINPQTLDRLQGVPPGSEPTIRQYINGVLGKLPDPAGPVAVRIPDAVVTGEWLDTRGPTWSVARPHHGVDFGVPTGTPCRSNTRRSRIAGVYGPGNPLGDGSFGRCIIVDVVGTPWWYLYAHLSAVWVQVGDWVEPYQVMGLTGGSGMLNGQFSDTAYDPHLHIQKSKDRSFPRDFDAGRPRNMTDDPFADLGEVQPAPVEEQEGEVTRAEYDALVQRIQRLENSRYQIGMQVFGAEPAADGRYVGAKDPETGIEPNRPAYADTDVYRLAKGKTLPAGEYDVVGRVRVS